MKIVGRNMSMVRGDSEVIVISCTDTGGNKIDFLDGDKVYLTIKESINTEEKILQKIQTVFENGDAVINIDPDDTKNVKYKTYVYDVQIIRASGKVTTIIPQSDFSVMGEVTYE